VAGSTSPGTAAAASASPGSKASRRRRPRRWIGRAGTSATAVPIPDRIRVVAAPNSGAPRASPTRPGGGPGHRRETCMRAHGQLAGNRSLAKGRAMARSSSCRPLLDAVDPATAPAGASGSPVADAPTCSSGSRPHLHSPWHLSVSRPLYSQPNYSEDGGAGMRSQTAMRRDARGTRDNDRPPTRISAGQPSLVGLAGLEPAPSSLSAIEGSALCGPAFSQVTPDRQG